MSYRVAIIEFIHESNTFSVTRTEMSDFYASHYFKGDEIPENFRGTGTEVGGAIEVAEALNWEPVYIIAAHAEPNGLVTEAARTEITKECIRRLTVGGPYDGVFVALHGSMVTETDQDGDCQFLREIRDVVGSNVPLAVTFDLHGNIFDELADLADIAVSFRTYPHVDMREVGIESCNLLHLAMAEEIVPKTTIRRPPMLLGCNEGRTTDNGPMCQLLRSAEREAKTDGILNVSVNAGFTEADVYAAGPSVLVTYNTRQIALERANTAADRICEEIWELRDHRDLPLPLATCIKQSKTSARKDKPIVIADYSDNPGSGAYSDCTALISALLEAGVTNAAAGALLDPEAVVELVDQGIGADVTLSIGGKTDPSVGGGPLLVTGQVIAISDGTFTFEGPMFTGLPGTTGQSVCLRVQGLDIMIVSNRMQMLDKNIFRVVGIEPTEKSLLAVKSMQHFKGAFASIASDIIVTDAGGLSTPDIKSRNYTRLRRPTFPLDEINDCYL